MFGISEAVERGATKFGLILCATLLACISAAFALAAFCIGMLNFFEPWLAALLTAALAAVIAGIVLLVARNDPKPPHQTREQPQRSSPLGALGNLPTPVLAMLASQAFRIFRRNPKTTLVTAVLLGLGFGMLTMGGSPEAEDDD